MVPIQHETDIEVLRRYTLWLEDANQELLKENVQLKGKLDGSRQGFLNDDLRDQLTRLREKFFGFGREELKTRADRPVGHNRPSLKMHGKRWEETPADGTPQDQRRVGSLPNSIIHDFNEKELEGEAVTRGILPKTASVWHRMKNFFQDSVEITVIERVYQKVVHRQAKYRLKDEYNTTGKQVIITAPGPVKLKPGCQYSVDFAISVVSDKYEYHLPLERQRRKMEAAGLDVDVKTLFSLCQTVAEHCDKSVIDKIRQDIFSDFCAVHLDESPWPIIGSDSTSYMWALSNRVGSYYQFEPTRSGKIAKELLKDYKGAVLTDGYAGYNRIKNTEGVRVGHCWSHARREFYERYDDFPNEVVAILKMIDELFDIEAKATTFEDLKQLRRNESKPLVDEIYRWLLDTRPRFLPGDGIVKAINYCMKFWPELTLFLTDLTLPLSNNDAERALRHIVMGRKNFAGSKTINGADVAATLYTVIESAKKVGLQPREYLKYLITERWHRREPLSPAWLSAEKFGKNKTDYFPPKNEWQI